MSNKLQKATIELNVFTEGSCTFIPFKYRGFIILSGIENVPEKDKDNLFVVIRESDGYRFLVGLDDSEFIGCNEIPAVNLESAIALIDWLSDHPFANRITQ